MEQLLSVQITLLPLVSPTSPLLSFSILYPSPSLFLSEPVLSPEPNPLPNPDEVDLQHRETLRKEYETLLAAHTQLQQTYAELVERREKTKRELDSLKGEYEKMREEQERIVKELMDANEILKREIARIEGELQAKEEHIKKLIGLMKERDLRKKNSEKLLDQLEKRNKELISEHVKRSFETEDLRKRASEHLSTLQKTKEDLLKQDENRRKREEQIQGLLGQIKRREIENAKLVKEMRRKDEENRDLTVQIQALAGRTEQESKQKAQKELEQMRSLAAAKEGEMRVVKEMIRSYHHQLKQKEVEVVRFKRKVEGKKAGVVRLPPLEEQKSAVRSQLGSNKDLAKVQDREEDEELADLIARSQQAFKPSNLISSISSSKADLIAEKEPISPVQADTPAIDAIQPTQYPEDHSLPKPEESYTEDMPGLEEVSAIQQPEMTFVGEIAQRETPVEVLGVPAEGDYSEDREEPSELIAAQIEANSDKSLNIEGENDEKLEENEGKLEENEALFSGEEEEYKEDWTEGDAEKEALKAGITSQYDAERQLELVPDDLTFRQEPQASNASPPASP